jgi:hypothetical protein
MDKLPIASPKLPILTLDRRVAKVFYDLALPFDRHYHPYAVWKEVKNKK